VIEKFIEYSRQLGEYSERLIRSAIAAIPDSRLQVCEDLFEDHGLGDPGVKLKLTGKIRGDSLTADFTGSGGSERHQRHLLVSQRVKDPLEELHRSEGASPVSGAAVGE